MLSNNKGFTLIELLVALAMFGIVTATIMSSFLSQNTSYKTQEQVAEMHQNLRAAMYFVGREIRMAGYDPLKSSGADIITANSNTLQISMDMTIDGDVDDSNEDIEYTFCDAYSDGNTDICRDTSGNSSNPQPLAENIDALDFVYLDDSNPPVVLNPGGGNVSAANIPNIRAVQITMVAKVGRAVRQYLNDQIYTNQQGTVILDKSATPDNLRRQLLTTTISCRNMGL